MSGEQESSPELVWDVETRDRTLDRQRNYDSRGATSKPHHTEPQERERQTALEVCTSKLSAEQQQTSGSTEQRGDTT